MNVVIDRAAFVLGSASHDLAGAARSVSGRHVLAADDLAALKRTIASVRATLDEAEAEVTAPHTGLTIPGTSWDDRNEIAAERAASTGAA